MSLRPPTQGTPSTATFESRISAVESGSVSNVAAAPAADTDEASYSATAGSYKVKRRPYIDLRDPYYGITFGSDPANSAANTAGIAAAHAHAITLGKKGIEFGAGQIVYDSLRLVGDGLHFRGHHAELTSTLGKTSNTIALQIVGGDIKVEDLIFDYTVPLDFTAAEITARGANGKTIRIGGERNGLNGQVGNLWKTNQQVIGCIFRDCRNTAVEFWFADICHLDRFLVERSLGNGVFASCVKRDLNIENGHISQTGDDGVFVACDSNLTALTQGGGIRHVTSEFSYAKNFGVSGVEDFEIAHCHGYDSWAPSIQVLQDAGLLNNKKVKLHHNTLRRSGTFYGAGQYKTTINVNPDSIYITNDPQVISLTGKNQSFDAAGRGLVIVSATDATVDDYEIYDAGGKAMVLGDMTDSTYSRIKNLNLRRVKFVRTHSGIELGGIDGIQVADIYGRSFDQGAAGTTRALVYGYLKNGTIDDYTFVNDDGADFTIQELAGTVQSALIVADPYNRPKSPPTDSWMPTGALAETISRFAHPNSNNLAVTSGTLRMSGGMVLRAGRTYSTITVMLGNTAMVTPSNQWFALYDKSTRALLGVTNDDTTTAWSVNTTKTLTLATPYTPSVDTPVYVAVLIVAATPPTLSGGQMLSGLASMAPAVAGMSTAGLTTPGTAPNPAAAVTGQHAPAYAYVS